MIETILVLLSSFFLPLSIPFLPANTVANLFSMIYYYSFLILAVPIVNYDVDNIPGVFPAGVLVFIVVLDTHTVCLAKLMFCASSFFSFSSRIIDGSNSL